MLPFGICSKQVLSTSSKVEAHLGFGDVSEIKEENVQLKMKFIIISYFNDPILILKVHWE